MLLFLLPLMVPPITYGIPLATVLYKVASRRHDLRRDPRQPDSRGAVRHPGDDAVHRADRSEPRVGRARVRRQHRRACSGTCWCRCWRRASSPRRCSCWCARSRCSSSRSSPPGPDSQTLVVALYYAVFAAGVRAPQSVDAMAMIYMARHAGLAPDRAALRQSDAARVAGQGTSAGGDDVECQRPVAMAGSSCRNACRLDVAVAELDAVAREHARATYDPARFADRHRASRARRVPSRAPGGLHRRRPRARSALGHLRRVAARRRASIDAARRAGRALHAAREGHATDVGARRSARCARLLFLGASATALVARIADPRVDDRHAHRHREGLLPRSGDRRAQLRAPGHRARPRASRMRRCRAIGLLVAALAARRARGAGALNVVCCDNLPHNGRDGRGHRARLRASAATRRSRDWIAAHVGVSRARWSTASCRRRPTPTSPRSRGASACTTPRRSSPSRSASG